MEYRRFGCTDLDLSVFSFGGMRLPRGWDENFTVDQLKPAERDQIHATIHRCIEVGINHLETARGYGNSEAFLAEVLPTIDRDRYVLQTKVVPDANPATFEAELERSLATLGADYIDLFGFHGINTKTELDRTLRRGGCMEVARRWQREGRIRHIGFSTHGSCPLICEAIESGEFAYVNLHWYFINQTNWPAIEAARQHDMGVFIISPTDKGGQLFAPSDKLQAVCEPLHPITFNDLFCLRRPEVHTLSLGASCPGDLDAHLAALDYLGDIDAAVAPIEERFHTAMKDALGADWWPDYVHGIPWYSDVPGELNLLYILRIWSLAKGMDMFDYGKYRYGMIEGGDGGTWMGGTAAVGFDDDAILECLRDHPQRERIPAILHQAHAWFTGNARQRLGSD